MSGQLGSIPYPRVVYDSNGNEVYLGASEAQPAQPAQPQVTVDAGMGGGGESEAERYIRERIREQIRLQQQDSEPDQSAPPPPPPAPPAASPAGMPVVPIDLRTGRPLGGMPGATAGDATGELDPTNMVHNYLRSHGMEINAQNVHNVTMANALSGRVIPGLVNNEPPMPGDYGPATPTAARSASPATSPGWFMPNTPLHQGNNVWLDPKTHHQMPVLDMSPPSLPYEDWQQPPPVTNESRASPAQSVVPAGHPYVQEATAQARQETQQPLGYGAFLARYWGSQHSDAAQRDYQQYTAFMQRHPSDPEIQQWVQNHAHEEAYARLLGETERGQGNSGYVA